MNINELNHDERLALVALLKAVILAEQRVPIEEREELQCIVEELGEEPYQSLLSEVDERFSSEDDVRQCLAKISRQDARELIYGTIMEMALSASIDRGESEVLGWLADAWKIKVRFGEPGE
jgi:hypothetical protein